MITNGLYSVAVCAQDGVDDGDTGLVLMRNGEILGGSSHFYWAARRDNELARRRMIKT